MIITKKIAEDIIKQNPHAPERAKVILIHEDGRVIYAEKFEQGSLFWFAETMKSSTIQGIIHKLTLVAERNDKGEFVALHELSPNRKYGTPLGTRQAKMLGQQEALTKARSTNKVVVAPAIIPAPEQTVKPHVHVEVKPAVVSEPEPPIVQTGLEGFISIRDLNPEITDSEPGQLFLSVRANGKIVFGKALRKAIKNWKFIDILATPDVKRIAIRAGKGHNNNKSGTHINRYLASKLSFPSSSATVRINLDWNEDSKAYIGDIK